MRGNLHRFVVLPRTENGSQLSRRRRLSAFPLGKVTRILQHNGEPLSWVRSLGFDAVLLSGPPDAAILSEAIRSRMLLYAPPPSSPDPSLQSLLEPVAGWYIGSGEALDSRQVDQTSHHIPTTAGMALALAATVGGCTFGNLAKLRAAAGCDHR